MIPLTNRQRQVLALLALGFEPAQVAVRLSVSKRTIDYHITAIYERTDSHAIVGGRLMPTINRTALYHARGFWGLAPATLERIAATGQEAVR